MNNSNNIPITPHCAFTLIFHTISSPKLLVLNLSTVVSVQERNLSLRIQHNEKLI